MGFYGQAVKAKGETEKENAREQLKVIVLGSYNELGDLDIDILKEKLQKINIICNGNLPYEKIELNGYYFTIERNGSVTDYSPFEPEVFTVTNKTTVKLGRNTTVSITSSANTTSSMRLIIKSLNVDKELEPTNKKAVAAGKTTEFKYSYTFKTKSLGAELGTVEIFIIASDKDGHSSEPKKSQIEVIE